ncbi:MAG: hypothetical protein K2Y35_16425 [Burkholderiales bacterium]|nr:hypothetical protein [Burkholderiales bacterium]
MIHGGTRFEESARMMLACARSENYIDWKKMMLKTERRMGCTLEQPTVTFRVGSQTPVPGAGAGHRSPREFDTMEAVQPSHRRRASGNYAAVISSARTRAGADRITPPGWRLRTVAVPD